MGRSSPNLQIQKCHRNNDCDGGHDNVCHGRVQEVYDVVDICTHQIDDLAPLNRLLRPATHMQYFLRKLQCLASCSQLTLGVTV